MKIYLSGPMSGHPNFNYPAFHAAAVALRAMGHSVSNPAENHPPACGTWQGYMRQAITQLVQCDCIALLDGWGTSQGAQIEHCLALDLELPAFPVRDITATSRVEPLQRIPVLDLPVDQYSGR